MRGTRRSDLRDPRAGERGQSAIAFIILILVIFMLFTLAFDVGLAAFDHRWAQNQAEAAALAGALQLPSDQDGPARDAAIQSLQRNGALDGLTYNQVDIWVGYSDAGGFHPGERNLLGKYDSVRVRLRRTAPAFFARLFEFGSISVDSILVSASATAKAGSAGAADRVMPWGIVPPCNDPNRCTRSSAYDLNQNKLYSLMCSNPGCTDWTNAPGNLGALRVCSNRSGKGGGTDQYRDCITLDADPLGITFEEGQTVVADKPGNMGRNTNDALTQFVTAQSGGYDSPASGFPCDVMATPDSQGMDGDMLQVAIQKAKSDNCKHRAVLIPIVNNFYPGSSNPSTILGLATYYIAGWDRTGGNWGDAGNFRVKDKDGKVISETGCVSSPPKPPKGGSVELIWSCGLVWGYFIPEYPLLDPVFALQKISDQYNPLAPILVALVD